MAPTVICAVEGCSKKYSTRCAMLLHTRKAHPGVEVEKFPSGPKAKENTDVGGAASASRRSLKWYLNHKDNVLAKKRQARMTGRVSLYRKYEKHRLRNLISSVLHKIAQSLSDDGIASGWHSTIISMLLVEVDQKHNVELFPIFAELPEKMLTKKTQESKKFADTFTKFRISHPKLIMDLHALLSALDYEETQLEEVDNISE